MLSQYAPIFGGIETIGQPWSRARQSLIGVHVLTFAALGAGVGLFLRWYRERPLVSGSVATSPATATESTKVEARLGELKALSEKGLLSQAEYEQKRAEILKSL